MNATKELPADFKELYKLDLSKDKGIAIWLNLTALVMLLICGVGFARFSMRIRPDLWANEQVLSYNKQEFISIILALVSMLILHEAVHGLFFLFITGSMPKFRLKLMYAYTAAPDWYIPRNLFFFATLAPLVILTGSGLALMVVFPLSWLPGLIFFLTLNAAGSVGDILVFTILMGHSSKVLVNDKGDSFRIYGTPPEDTQPGLR